MQLLLSHEKIFFSSKVCVASSFVKVENFLLHTTTAKNQILPKPAFTIAKNCLKFWDGKSFMRTLAVFFMEISSDHQFWKRCTNICQVYCLKERFLRQINSLKPLILLPQFQTSQPMCSYIFSATNIVSSSSTIVSSLSFIKTEFELLLLKWLGMQFFIPLVGVLKWILN